MALMISANSSHTEKICEYVWCPPSLTSPTTIEWSASTSLTGSSCLSSATHVEQGPWHLFKLFYSNYISTNSRWIINLLTVTAFLFLIILFQSRSESKKLISPPWLNDHTWSLKRLWRKLERKWKLSQQLSTIPTKNTCKISLLFCYYMQK